MHIAEGVLPGPILLAGGAVTTAGIAVGLSRMDADATPKVALVAATLYVASLLRVPVGPSHAHLVLNGLAGILLGWSIFPALFVALLMQAWWFQFGGLTTLGVNVAIMALPGLMVHFLYRVFSPRTPRAAAWAGILFGALAVAASAGLVALVLSAAGRPFATVGALLFAAHLPVILADGAITGVTVGFLAKVRPNALPARSAGAR